MKFAHLMTRFWLPKPILPPQIHTIPHAELISVGFSAIKQTLTRTKEKEFDFFMGMSDGTGKWVVMDVPALSQLSLIALH